MGVLGVILGILALLCAVMATFLFGTVGGVVAGVLAVGAVVLGFLKRNKQGKGGMPAIIIGIIAVILAVSLTNTWSMVFSEMHHKAVELKPDGLWAQVSEDVSGGVVGLINNLPKDEATLNALVEEMDELNKLAEK